MGRWWYVSLEKLYASVEYSLENIIAPGYQSHISGIVENLRNRQTDKKQMDKQIYIYINIYTERERGREQVSKFKKVINVFLRTCIMSVCL